MAGHGGKPEATAAAIIADGWLRSGDGGHIDADGCGYVTDRIKDMIISCGDNIYPALIDRMLAERTALQEAAVIGVLDERWGEVPKAVVVTKPGWPWRSSNCWPVAATAWHRSSAPSPSICWPN